MHAALWTLTLATEVVIDIRPRSEHNRVDPYSRRLLPVAILTTADFDATTVNPWSVRFGPGEARAVGARIRDANDDGSSDLVLRFRIRRTGIQCGDTEATARGATFDGEAILGTDSIQTVGCE